ncbi:MAG TPA: ATP-binding protein [Acidimicrobiales bacterium]|nr:ATP-binding protein [Acidimicrobiales bacterium]
MTRRLVLSYVALTVLVVVALAWPLGHTFSSRERDQLFRDIEHDADVIATLSEDALEQHVKPPIDATLARYAKNPGGRIVVVDTAGRSVADSQQPATLGVDFTNRAEIRTALAGRLAEGQRHSKTLNGNLLYVAIPVASSGVVHGAVRVTYPSSTLDTRIRNLWIALASLGVIVVAIAAAIGFGLARLVTSPVERLKTAATRIAAGDLSARAPTDSGAPELRELATVFNDSAAQVQAALDAQQAFVADASHQLRTPLAALRLQLENIESRAPAQLQGDLAAARSETARLTRITDTLLTLARVPETTSAVAPVDLASVVRCRVETWQSVAAEVGVSISVDTADVWVMATTDALDQILDNLIDNALEVAPDGSAVDVSVDVVGDHAVLHVADRGPGLDDDQRARAFDRFWRGPDATAGGTGLGLAIVGQLVNGCGGTAQLLARDGGGIDAVVTLRLTRPIRPA